MRLLDLIPHKDVSAHKAEGLLVLIMLGLVGTSCGLKSPAFWCAMGGVLPDVEQVLPWTDPKRGHRRWFPTHNRAFPFAEGAGRSGIPGAAADPVGGLDGGAAVGDQPVQGPERMPSLRQISDKRGGNDTNFVREDI